MRALALLLHLLTGGVDTDLACVDSPDTCQTDRVPVRVLYAVAAVESGGRPWARRGRHIGAWQQRSDTAGVHPLALWLPPIQEAVADKHLTALLARTDGRLVPALAAYRCGWSGAQGACRRTGEAYARRVLRLAQGWRWYDGE